MATYINAPVIVLFVEGSDRMPQYWHKKFDTALPEASRLAETTGKNVWFIEYGVTPSILGHIDIDGVFYTNGQEEAK